MAAPACPCVGGSLSAHRLCAGPQGERDGAGHQGWERLGRHPLRSERGVGMGPLPVAVRFPWGKNVDFLKFVFFFFGHAARLAGSQLPEQGLNLGHNRESPES